MILKKKKSNVRTFLLYKYYLRHFYNIVTTVKYFVNNFIFVSKPFIKKKSSEQENYIF